VIKDALSQYALGKGSQSAVIKAQMERTQILRQDTMHNQNLWQAQARLKKLLAEAHLDIEALKVAFGVKR